MGEKKKTKTCRAVYWVGKVQEASAGELLKISRTWLVRDLGDSSYRSNELSQAACSIYDASGCILLLQHLKEKVIPQSLIQTIKKELLDPHSPPQGVREDATNSSFLWRRDGIKAEART